jgi:hypothetical protein
VTITNNGTAVGVLTVTPSGVGIAATGCTGSLAINAPCTLSITAAPSAAGAIVGTVTVSAAGGNTITIGVTGTATLPGNFTLTPSVIPLGDVAAGDTKQATVVVTANAALTGMTTSAQGADLKVDPSSNCTGTMTAGQTCNIVVNFSSATPGSPTGDAIVVGQGGVTKSVPVTANVLAPAKLAATPPSGALVAVPGSVSTANLEVNVGNIGGMPTGTLAIAIGGTNAADFKVLSENCSIVTLAASKFCTVTVQYAPAAAVTAAEAASLTITDKGPGASVATVALSGTPTPVTPPSTLTLTGATTALGSVAPGSSGAEVLFTVTNTAATPSGALTAALAPSGSITISSNACAAKATLAQNETCTIGLRLTPAAGATPQPVSATLTVTGATAKAPVSVVVTGAIVTGPALQATPASISFGSIPVNQSSTAQTVTIKNTGATATGVLGVTLSGTGAAQVAIVGNACTASLAPSATCTVAVQYSPTDTTGVNGTILVSDGASSVSIPTVGTGLAPSVFQVTPQPFPAFGSVVVGYSASASSAQVLKLDLLPNAPTDSGTITTTFSGTNAADYSVDATNSNCTLIQPGQSCTITLKFSPAAAGNSTAVLTIKGSKGGSYDVALAGKGLSLVEIEPLTLTDSLGNTITGLDFGQQTLGIPGLFYSYLAVVRGASTTTATSTVASVTLTTPQTTPDFRNYPDPSVNACSGATLDLTKIGSAATSPVPTTAGTWYVASDNGGTYWACKFQIQFYPQTAKGATSATITASATGSGNDSKPLTGTATGPMAINPSTFDFGSVNFGNASLDSTGVTLSINETVLDGGIPAAGAKSIGIFVVKNNGVAAEGPLTVSSSSADFVVIDDQCTAKTLTASVGTCKLYVEFIPTAAGARSGTLTVTSASSSEVATAALTGTGGQPLSIEVDSPAGTAVGTLPVDLPPVAQAAFGAWQTFTIKNPAGANLTGKLSYGFGSGLDATDSATPSAVNFELFTLTSSSTGYPAGSCGNKNTSQLAGGTNCTIQVRFRPTNAQAASTTPRSATLHVVDSAGKTVDVLLHAVAIAQLSLTGSEVINSINGVPTVTFGNVGVGATASKSVTVGNNGDPASTAVALHILLPPHYSVGTSSPCTEGLSMAGGSTCRLDLVYTGTADGSQVPVGLESGTLAISNVTPVASTNSVYASVAVTATSVQAGTLALYGFGDYPLGTPTLESGASQPIDLGSVPISGSTGQLVVWFTNSGQVTITGLQNNVVETGGGTEFVVDGGTCTTAGTTLAPAGTCSLIVHFTPTALATKTATLTLLATAIAPASVNLKATGIQTANAVFAFAKNVTGNPSFFNFPGSTAALSAVPTATGTKAYFVLTNNQPAGTIALNLGTDTSTPPLMGGAIVKLPGFGRPADFIMTKEADAGTVCGQTLASGSSCTFAITFKPGAWDTAGTATLYRWAAIGSNGTGGPALLGVLGQVQKPAKLKLTATSTATITVPTGATGTVDFGQITENQTASLTFTITNVGEAATAGAVQAALTGTPVYATVALSAACGASLPANGTCTATVTVGQNASIGAHTTMAIQATGAASEASAETYTLGVKIVNAAHIVLTGTPLSFGTPGTFVGQPGGVLHFTIANGVPGTDTPSNRQDSGAVTVALPTTEKNFTLDLADGTATTSCAVLAASQSRTDGTFTLPGGTSCTVAVNFLPTAVGALSTQLSAGVAAGAGGSATPLTLTGTGLGDLVILAPTISTTVQSTAAAPFSFGSSLDLIVTNKGAGSTGLLRTSVGGGATAAQFTVIYDSCTGQGLVTGAESCKVTVLFTGTASTTTPQTATVTVGDGSPANAGTAFLKAVPPA